MWITWIFQNSKIYVFNILLHKQQKMGMDFPKSMEGKFPNYSVGFLNDTDTFDFYSGPLQA